MWSCPECCACRLQIRQECLAAQQPGFQGTTQVRVAREHILRPDPVVAAATDGSTMPA
jgi:hypothetical protein